MPQQACQRALFLLTREWSRNSDSDDVMGETGCSIEDCGMIWESILEARAANAKDYLTCRARTTGDCLLEFPSGHGCLLNSLGFEVYIEAGNLSEDEHTILQAIPPATLQSMFRKALPAEK